MAYFSRKGECIIYFISPVHLSLQLNVTQHPRSPRVLVGVCVCTNGALWIRNEMQMLKKALKLKRVPWAFSYRSLSCVHFLHLLNTVNVILQLIKHFILIMSKHVHIF